MTGRSDLEKPASAFSGVLQSRSGFVLPASAVTPVSIIQATVAGTPASNTDPIAKPLLRQ